MFGQPKEESRLRRLRAFFARFNRAPVVQHNPEEVMFSSMVRRIPTYGIVTPKSKGFLTRARIPHRFSGKKFKERHRGVTGGGKHASYELDY